MCYINLYSLYGNILCNSHSGDEEDLKHQPAQVQDEASDNENSDEETSSDVNDQEQYFENGK